LKPDAENRPLVSHTDVQPETLVNQIDLAGVVAADGSEELLGLLSQGCEVVRRRLGRQAFLKRADFLQESAMLATQSFRARSDPWSSDVEFLQQSAWSFGRLHVTLQRIAHDTQVASSTSRPLTLTPGSGRSQCRFQAVHGLQQLVVLSPSLPGDSFLIIA
jgi:hypothetical protein